MSKFFDLEKRANTYIESAGAKGGFDPNTDIADPRIRIRDFNTFLLSNATIYKKVPTVSIADFLDTYPEYSSQAPRIGMSLLKAITSEDSKLPMEIRESLAEWAQGERNRIEETRKKTDLRKHHSRRTIEEALAQLNNGSSFVENEKLRDSKKAEDLGYGTP